MGVNSEWGIIVMGLCVSCFAFGFFVSNQFEKANKTKELSHILEQKEQVEKERVLLEERLNQVRTEQGQKAKVIVRKVNHEIEKIVYRECVVPDDGVRLINEAAGLYAAR